MSRWTPALSLGLLGVLLAACGESSRVERGVGSGDDPEYRALVDAAAGFRPVEARLYGMHHHAPYTRAAQIADREAIIRFRRISSQIRAEAASGATGANLGALGLVELYLQRHDAAVARLEQASALAPRDPRLLTNLSAAYLGRAAATGRGDDLVRAFSAADEATTVSPGLPEASFNRALTLGRLGLLEEAAREWVRYLRSEAEPDWRAEALSQLRAVRAPRSVDLWTDAKTRLVAPDFAATAGNTVQIVERFPQFARLLAQDDLLGKWAHEESAGHKHAAECALDAARAIARSLAAVNHDDLLQQAVDAIDVATASRDTGRVQRLLRGHRDYADGLAAYEVHELPRARSLLSSAERELAAAGSPFFRWPDLYLSVCDYYDSRFAASLRQLEILAGGVEEGQFPALRGRIAWIAGLDYTGEFRATEALRSYRRALVLFEQLSESGNIAHLEGTIAFELGELGENVQAWRHLVSALDRVGDLNEPRRRYSLFQVAAGRALAIDEPRAALLFSNAVVHAAEEWSAPAAISEGGWWRSRILRALGRNAEARKDLELAGETERRVGARVLRTRIDGDLRMVAAEAETDPRPRASLFTEALETYQRIGNEDNLGPIYLRRGQAYSSSG